MSQFYNQQRPSPRQARPSLPPVPPLLKQHPTTTTVNHSGLPLSISLEDNPTYHRPPLPPVPPSYLAQANADHHRQLLNQQAAQPPPPHFPTPIAAPSNDPRQSALLPTPAPFIHHNNPDQPTLSRAQSFQFATPNHHHQPGMNNLALSRAQTQYLPSTHAPPNHHPQQHFQQPPSAQPSRSNSPNPTKPIALPAIDVDYLALLHQQWFVARPEAAQQVKWASKVIKYIENSQTAPDSATPDIDKDTQPGNTQQSQQSSTKISNPTLVKFTDIALRTILQFAAHHDRQQSETLSRSTSTPPVIPQAVYLRGDLSSTGAFPSYKTKDLKSAFRDFEAAAQLGFHLAWFRIGREYEACEDWDRALGAYQHGQNLGECACTYRLGMCYLLGQIQVAVDMRKAVGYLRAAAQLADEETPQPAYIYGMLLAGEFEALPRIPSEILASNLIEARQMIEKAAYFGFAAAQYKMGWCYEYSHLGCIFDPLMSVEYYTLAAKQEESEAEMALSKWFLCGAEGHFTPNEGLAFTFAEKAAKKGLGSAMFAVGYYLEVGIGVAADGEQALRWYKKAWEGHQNEDAQQRMMILEGGGKPLSRGEHELHLDQKLVRQHTLAAERTPVEALKPSSGLRRRETLRKVEEARWAGEHSRTVRTPTTSGPPSLSPSSRDRKDDAGHMARYQTSPSPSPGAHQTQFPPTPSPPHSQAPPHHLRHQNSRPQMQAKRPMQSYQLVDDGPLNKSTGRNPNIVEIEHQANPTRAQPVKFNSFADMGIQTAKAKKSEDCIIV